MKKILSFCILLTLPVGILANTTWYMWHGGERKCYNTKTHPKFNQTNIKKTFGDCSIENVGPQRILHCNNGKTSIIYTTTLSACEKLKTY